MKIYNLFNSNFKAELLMIIKNYFSFNLINFGNLQLYQVVEVIKDNGLMIKNMILIAFLG